MQDDRDREQPASGSEPPRDEPPRDETMAQPSDETAAEFESAPTLSPPATAEVPAPEAESPEDTPSEDTPSEDAPREAAQGGTDRPAADQPDAAAAEEGPGSSEPVDWPAADAEAVPSTPDQSRDEPSVSDPVEWPAEPAGPPPQEAEAYPATPAVDEAAPAEAAHSVPATQVGESTQCPRCGTENRPGIAFCRNCGQRLVAAGVATTVERPGTPDGTQQCPRCGTHNRAGVAFCQNCGANLRVAATPAPGYIPPATTQGAGGRPAEAPDRASRGGAILGPIVLIVGALGLATAWLLPFPYGDGSLWERSFGAAGGWGVAFWDGYSSVGGGILDSAYFGFAAAVPVLAALLVLLAIAGFLRAAPGGLQLGGLVIALLWAIGLGATFVMLEVGGNWNGSLIDLLRALTPAGIIFLLGSLIVIIGVLTRFARS